jgi:hypothetical protein
MTGQDMNEVHELSHADLEAVSGGMVVKLPNLGMVIWANEGCYGVDTKASDGGHNQIMHCNL